MVVPEGVTARAAMASVNRARFTEMFGHDHSHATDAELLDAFTYNVFPNFGPWGGYIFIKENPGGPTLEEYLAPLPEHFQRWKHEDCVTTAWVGKVIHANWKVTAEAFMEAWHSVITHPQILPFTGDANTRYNVYGDHVNVALTPFAVM